MSTTRKIYYAASVPFFGASMLHYASHRNRDQLGDIMMVASGIGLASSILLTVAEFINDVRDDETDES